MPRTMTVKIPLMVGSNGKWSAYGYGEEGTPHDCDDWGMLADNLMDYDSKDKPSDPDATTKHYIIATITVPDAAPNAVAADAVEAV